MALHGGPSFCKTEQVVGFWLCWYWLNGSLFRNVTLVSDSHWASRSALFANIFSNLVRVLTALSQARRGPTHPFTVMFYTPRGRAAIRNHGLAKSRQKSLSDFVWHLLKNMNARPSGIEHYGKWVCRPTTSLRDAVSTRTRLEKMLANNADRLAQWESDTRVTLRNREPFSQYWAQSKVYQQPAQFYRMTVLHAVPFNRLSLPIATDLHPVCELLHLRLSLF